VTAQAERSVRLARAFGRSTAEVRTMTLAEVTVWAQALEDEAAVRRMRRAARR
jgi:hypothetical protein